MPLPIYDGPMQTGCATLEDWIRGPLAMLAQRSGIKVPALTVASEQPDLAPRVNHNRWIADCPDCRGAEFLWPEGLFMCAACWNGAIGNRWRRVRVPVNRPEIDDVLMARPLPANRNWEPGETVAELEAENLSRGLSLRQAPAG